MDRDGLRDLIRHKLNNGDLPIAVPTYMQVSNGSGATCSACGEPIAANQSEHQLNYSDGRRPPAALQLHRDLGDAAPRARVRAGVLML
jgi:hypothetical protein